MKLGKPNKPCKRLQKFDKRFAKESRLHRLDLNDQAHSLTVSLPMSWLNDDIQEYDQNLSDPITFVRVKARRMAHELAGYFKSEFADYLEPVTDPVERELLVQAGLALKNLQRYVGKQKRRELKARFKAEKEGRTDATE